MGINENINLCEDYVSFETAKLLKEKGFNYVYCCAAYNKDGSFFWHGDYSRNWKGVVDAPTLQMAMKWLDEIHHKFIVVDKHFYVIDKLTHIASGFTYSYEIKYANTIHKEAGFHTSKEACDAAIKYCLTNLI